MVTDEMKALRAIAGLTVRDVGARLGISGEAYRLKENGRLGITGPELAKLARVYGKTVTEAFPSYQPTEGERMLSEDISAAA